MATATSKPNGSAPVTNQQQQARPASDTPLVDQILATMQPTRRAKEVRDALTHPSVIERVRSVLPDALKGEADRFVRRAAGTFQRSESLKDCPVAEFGRCVIEAAEMGLAVDGKLCYVVHYKGGHWQVSVDYKGLIAIAKRTGAIVECYSGIVRANDEFSCGRDGLRSYLHHTFDPRIDRGPMIGAYAGFVLPDNQFDFCFLNMEELAKIRAASKARYPGRPWEVWGEEMSKKSAVRRGLKMHIEDPGLVDAFGDYDDSPIAPTPAPSPSVLTPGRHSVKRMPAPAVHVEEEQPAPVYDEHAQPEPVDATLDAPALRSHEDAVREYLAAVDKAATVTQLDAGEYTKGLLGQHKVRTVQSLTAEQLDDATAELHAMVRLEID